MSVLLLDMRPNDMIIINGAPIRVHGRVRLELNGHARFLFGKQIMAPGENNSPARRIYYAIQTAYIGNEDERGAGRADAQRFCDDFAEATTSEMVRKLLAEAMHAVGEDRCYQALKIVKRIMAHEDAVMAITAKTGAGAEAAVGASQERHPHAMESAA